MRTRRRAFDRTDELLAEMVVGSPSGSVDYAYDFYGNMTGKAENNPSQAATAWPCPALTDI